MTVRRALTRPQETAGDTQARSPRIFYGWWVVAALTLVCFAAYGGGVYAFVVFVSPLEHEFGWSRAVTGGSVSIFWISAVLPPFLGAWVNRRDPRSLILLGALIEAVCLMLIARIDSVWQLYALRAAMGMGKVMMIVPLPVVVARWFAARKGIALGVTIAGAHIGGLVLAPCAQLLIEALGWREAAVVLGAVLLILAFPVVAVLRVQGPGDLGLGPDGNPISAASGGGTQQVAEGLTVRQTLRTSLFWAIATVTAVYYLSYSGVLAHVTAYLTDSGIAATHAAGALGLTAAFAALGVLGFGAAVDRWNIKSVLIAILILFAIGVSILFAVTQGAPTWPLYAFVALFGLAIGGGDVVWMTLLRVCFGEKDYGGIWGTWYMVMLLALTCGSILVGHLYDVSQTYRMAFAAIVSGVLLGAAVMLFTPVRRVPAPSVTA